MNNYRENIMEIRAALRKGDTANVAKAVGCTTQTVRNAMRKSQAVTLTKTEEECIEMLAAITAPRIRAARRLESNITETLRA